VFVSHRIVSDPAASRERLSLVQLNVPLTAAAGDPTIPGIRAQRVLLVLGFAAVAFAMGYLVHPIAALIIALCFASVGVISLLASGVAIATALIVLVAIWRGDRPREGESPSPALGRFANGSIAARSLPIGLSFLALGTTGYLFFPVIFQHSFFSQDEIWLASDALAMAWTALFVATSIWFVRTGAGAALFFCAVFASFSVLTRPGSVFVVALFAALCVLGLWFDWRRFLVAVIACAAVAVVLINSVIIYGAATGHPEAGVQNSHTTVVIGFALSIAKPEDESVLRDDTERRFFRAAMARREAALARVAPDDPAAQWSGIVEIYNEAAWPAVIEVLGVNDGEKANALFLRVTRAIAFNRPFDYARLVLECLGAGAGVGKFSTARLFHSYADWLVLLALVALTLFGALQDRLVGLIAAFLVAGHFANLLVAALSVTPASRYAQSTDWMVVIAILLMVLRQLELLFQGGPRAVRHPFGAAS